MHKMCGILLAVVSLVAMATADAQVLLYAPLRDGVVPTTGAVVPGSPTNGCRFVGGRQGNALVLDAAAAKLAYALPLDSLRGSVACWIKLDRLPAAPTQPIPFLELRGAAETLTIKAEVNVYKSLMLACDSYRTRVAKAEAAGKWAAEWHHVVFTWTGTWLHWYVDGRELPTMLFSGGDDETERAITGRLAEFLSFPPPETGTRLVFLDTGSAIAIQDLAVYGWALSPQEAGRLAAGAAPGELAAGGPVVDVAWAPGPRRVDLILDPAPARLVPASADVRVVSARTRKEVGATRIEAFPRSLGVACFDAPGLDTGICQVQVTFKDARGKKIGSARSGDLSFDRSKYPWLWNDIGITDAVLPPWTPVVAKKDKVSTWGRTYDLGVLGLPKAITTAGAQILARPIELAAEIAGNPAAWTRATAPDWDDVKAARATGRATARADALNVETDVSVDYDGNVSCVIRLAPRDTAAPVALTGLHLDIPLRASHASLLHAWADMSFAGFVPPGQGKVWDSLALPRERGAFVPFIWVGDDDRGLAWHADNDEAFALSGTNAPIELIRQADEVLVRIRLVDRPVTLTGPRTLRFGLMATPVKPLPARWRALEFGGTPIQDGGNYFWWWPGSEGRRTQGWAGFEPYPKPEAEGRAFAQRAHANGQYVVPFINAHFSGGLPAHDFWEELRRFPEGGLVYENATRTVADFNLYHLDRWSRGEGAIDGLYIDESYVCGPAVNPMAGMGYYDTDGAVRPGYGLSLVRDYFRRLYTMFKQNGRDGMIWQHSTLFHVPMIAAYAGTTCDGENDLASTNAAVGDYIDHLLEPDPVGRSDFKGRLGRLRAIGRSQPYGVPGSYLRYTQPPGDPGLIDQHAAVMGLCDIIPVEETIKFRTAKQEFGIGAADVEFRPFWNNTAWLSVAPTSVLASVYHRPGRDLIYVVNSERRPVEATIGFSAAAGVALDKRVAYDPFTRERLTSTGQVIRVSLPSHGHRLVMLLPPPNERAPKEICFHADFEGTLDARASRNTAYGRGDGRPPEWGPGYDGQGLRLGREQGIAHYLAPDNADPMTGTLTFRLKLNQPPTQWFQFLSLPVGAGVQFGVAPQAANPLVMNISPQWKATSAKQPLWPTNVWRHVAATWTGGRQFRLYLDGEPLDALDLPDSVPLPAAAYPSWITLGSAPRQGDTSSDMTIDELVIRDRCLTPEEIRENAR